MRNEVEALVKQLTAERNRIDIAILALKAMGVTDDATAMTSPVLGVGQRQPWLTEVQKAEIRNRLSRGERPAHVARAMGLGAPRVYKLRDQDKSNNRALVDVQPDSNEMALGVQ